MTSVTVAGERTRPTDRTDRLWRIGSLGIGAAGLVGLLFAPHLVNSGTLFIVGLALIQSIFALSWNLLFGYVGLASFGHAGFFALGAYFTGAAMRYDLGIPFLLLLAASFLIGAAIAFAIGVLALRRLAGIFLAVMTVALAEVLGKIIAHTPMLGERDGLSNIPRPVIAMGPLIWDLRPIESFYYFLLLACGLIVAALWWLGHSRFGRVFRAIRQDAARAEFIGIDVAFYRVVAFTVSGGVAALAGAMFAPWTRIVTLDDANWLASTQPILASLLGGFTSFWGPVVGTVAFTLINYGTRTFVGLYEIIVGGVLLAVVLLAPTGLMGLLDRFRRFLAARERNTVRP